MLCFCSCGTRVKALTYFSCQGLRYLKDNSMCIFFHTSDFAPLYSFRLTKQIYANCHAIPGEIEARQIGSPLSHLVSVDSGYGTYNVGLFYFPGKIWHGKCTAAFVYQMSLCSDNLRTASVSANRLYSCCNVQETRPATMRGSLPPQMQLSKTLCLACTRETSVLFATVSLLQCLFHSTSTMTEDFSEHPQGCRGHCST